MSTQQASGVQPYTEHEVREHAALGLAAGHTHGHRHVGLDALALGAKLAQVAAQDADDTTIHWLFEPHAAQQQILDCDKREIVARCGRRFGKTWIMIRWLVEEAGRAMARGIDCPVVWWIAPTYQASMRALRDAIKLLPRRYRRVLRGEKALVLPNGVRIEFKSADNPDALRGEGLAAYVADEAAYIAEYVFTDVLDPMLLSTGGRKALISTPGAKTGYFYDRAMLAETGADPEIASFWFPTNANTSIPHIDAEVERLRRTMPEASFRREILAEFLDSMNTPLAGARDLATLTALSGPAAGRHYVAGIDFGRAFDFTVVPIFDRESGEMVALFRWTGKRYSEQLDEIKQIARTWRLEALVAEVNNMGDPLVEKLTDDGLPMVPWRTTNASKVAAIRCLELAINTETIHFLADKTLVAEMVGFEETTGETGLVKMAAAGRMHDDIVMSVSFVWYYLHGNDPELGGVAYASIDITEYLSSTPALTQREELPRDYEHSFGRVY